MGRQKGTCNLEDLAVDGMTLKLILSKHGQVAGTCEYGREPSGSIEMRGIYRLAAKTGQLLKKDSALWSK
jgi:hypothetical protein